MTSSAPWIYWALASAVFAALTAIFAKIGLAGVDSDFATLIRTAVIIAVLALFVFATGKWSDPLALSGRTWLFLVLSGLATGISWVCYFRALKVGPASQFAFVFLDERPSQREWLGITLVGLGVLILGFKR